MAIINRILARLPQGFMRFDYPREKKEWKQFVIQNGGQVINLGGGAFQARIDGRLCGWWNPSTKSAWVDFDVRWGLKAANKHKLTNKGNCDENAQRRTEEHNTFSTRRETT